MNIGDFARSQFVRFLATICLLIGLADASRLLGVSTGAENPVITLGTTGFVLLATFTIARLFAAVGLWINASWGAALLIGATLVELVLVIANSDNISISTISLIIRFLLLVAIIAILAGRFWQAHRNVHD